MSNPSHLKPPWRAVAVTVSAALLLTACGNGQGESNEDRTDLTIGISADPRSLLGTTSTVVAESMIAEQITEKLVVFSADGTGHEPRLATEWEQISPTAVQLTLREGVTFTNGEPFNAESAKASIEHLMQAPAHAQFTSMLEDVEIIDEHTITVVSSEPSGLILDTLADGGYMLPVEYFEDVGEEEFGTAPIGTGPYELEEWLSGNQITMTANSDYWGEEPQISELTWQVIPEKTAQVSALQSGSIQLMQDVPIGSLSTVEGDESLDLITTDSSRVFYVAFSTETDTPLQEKEVRQALQYAINSESIVENQLSGHGTLLDGQLLPDFFTGYNPDLEATPYDPDRATELLAEAGHADGFEITFKYSNGRYPQDREIGQAIADQLSQVGLTINQEELETGTFLTQLTDIELNDMFYMGALTPPDGQRMLQQFQTGAAYSYYSNPDIDELLDEALSVVDPEDREEILGEISEMYAEDPAFIPMFQGVDAYGAVAGLNIEPHATQFIDVRSISYD